MGSDIADFDNDGRPDVLVLDMLADDPVRRKLLKGPDGWQHYQQSLGYGYHHQFMRNTLHRNDGDGTFSEVGRLAGIASTDWSWSPLLADFDNDGWQDLLITNGYLRDYTNLDFLKSTMADFFEEMRTRNRSQPLFELVKEMPRTVVRDHLFRNGRDYRFDDVSEAWGIEEEHFSNGAAYADLDNDGDLDLVINHLNEKSAIYRNESESRGGGHYLKVRLMGDAGNPFGIGARVTLTTPGGTRHFREMIPSRGFQSSMEPVMHFGTGPSTSVDLHVRWPDGAEQELTGVSVDGTLVLEYEEAQSPSGPGENVKNPQFVPVGDALGIDFVHRENPFMDFEREPLLPHLLSRFGPAVATGDVNGDFLPDLYIGGARGQPASLYLQAADASFRRVQVDAFETDSLYEDVDAALFDADGDGDMDLFVVSGDTEIDSTDAWYEHRLYRNNGFGGFSRDRSSVPAVASSGGVVAVHDWDRDGDTDLFVGGRVVPGSYPAPAASFLLENEGGRFTDVTEAIAPDLARAGMITSAVWADVTGDGISELVIAGEWTAVRVFEWAGAGSMLERTAASGLSDTDGWWRSLAASDIDGDGDIDLVAGNRGLNGLLSASQFRPLEIVAGDSDHDGAIEGILAQRQSEVSVPVHPRDLVVEALPFLAERFPDYVSYARASMDDVLLPEERAGAFTLRAKTFASTLFENQGDGRFREIPLPIEAQLAPVTAIEVMDFDGDGLDDVLLAGNDFGVHPDEGRYDAGRGLLLRGTGTLEFQVVRAAESGFFAPLDVRGLAHVPTRRGSVIIVANNDGPVSVFGVIRQSGPPGGADGRTSE
jgi:hypothetical protein